MPERETASDIEDAANLWAAKAERGLTAEDRRQLDQWLEGDSRRLGAFVRAQAAWIHAERAVALGTMPETESTLPQEPAHNAPRRRTPDRRMILGGGVALAAAFAGAYVVNSGRYRTLESGVGEIRRLVLKCGTVLTLDTDTRVDISASSDDRRLELVRGKLFVDAPRWRDRPLVVKAGGLVLQTAEGAFGVQNLGKTPIVALVTGGTLIASQSRGMFGAKQAVTVEKDHALTFAPDTLLAADAVRSVAAARQAQLLAWRDGMLSFGGERLVDAVRAFDRYGPVRIVVADPELARQRITGLFKADDPKGFAIAIAASLGGVAESQGETIRISAKKSVSA
uniref:FecR family protein n=1 Tax=uncultured Caulobacter sp. TaxID=158749 RepID=UPI0025F2D290|nr:FecR domain-containing protein [uncultured Caulobacter sp.]